MALEKAKKKFYETGDKVMDKGEELFDRIKGSSKDTIDNLEAFYLKELQDLVDSESQIIEALPMMVAAADNPVLKDKFQKHLEETKAQREKLINILRERGEPVNAKTCEGMKGILKEGKEILKSRAPPNVRDVALIASAQKVEHYEVASYESLIAYAKLLDEKEEERTLKEILQEEESTSRTLNDLATKDINIRSVEGSA
jgi:ferritin-like metal-binding protein YciE